MPRHQHAVEVALQRRLVEFVGVILGDFGVRSMDKQRSCIRHTIWCLVLWDADQGRKVVLLTVHCSKVWGTLTTVFVEWV